MRSLVPMTVVSNELCLHNLRTHTRHLVHFLLFTYIFLFIWSIHKVIALLQRSIGISIGKIQIMLGTPHCVFNGVAGICIRYCQHDRWTSIRSQPQGAQGDRESGDVHTKKISSDKIRIRSNQIWRQLIYYAKLSN